MISFDVLTPDTNGEILEKLMGLISEADENELLLIEAWETKHHQEIHITQPHMARLRAMKGDYIASTTLGEFEVK